MSNDQQFLSFKGLKYYNPSEGWNEINDTKVSYINRASKLDSRGQQNLTEPMESIKVPTEARGMFFDQLMKDLLDRVCADNSDELSSIWNDIVEEIDLLEQYFSTKHELLKQLNVLDQEANELRATIISHLDKVQALADQQVFTANLRARISTVAQSRLLIKLEKVETELTESGV